MVCIDVLQLSSKKLFSAGDTTTTCALMFPRPKMLKIILKQKVVRSMRNRTAFPQNALYVNWEKCTSVHFSALASAIIYLSLVFRHFCTFTLLRWRFKSPSRVIFNFEMETSWLKCHDFPLMFLIHETGSTRYLVKCGKSLSFLTGVRHDVYWRSWIQILERVQLQQEPPISPSLDKINNYFEN